MRECFRASVASLLIMLLNVPYAGADDAEISRPSLAAVPPELYLVRPGTYIADGPPASWSHLVVKAQTRLAAGDLDTLPSWAARTAATIRTIVLADVARLPGNPPRFALNKVGIGLCMTDRNGRDVVVNSAKAVELGFEFGTLDKLVFESAEAEVAKGRLMVATATFAIHRSPTTMLIRGEHRAVDLFYGLLVDPESGSLRVVVWSRETKPLTHPTIKRLVELRPSLVYECPLDVKASRLLGTIPVSWTFAMQDLLPGQVRAVPPELAELMDASATAKPDPRILEKALNAYLSTRSTVRGTPSADSTRAPDAAAESDPGR